MSGSTQSQLIRGELKVSAGEGALGPSVTPLQTRPPDHIHRPDSVAGRSAPLLTRWLLHRRPPVHTAQNTATPPPSPVSFS